MKRADELISAMRHVTVAVPDLAGRLFGKRRPIADWPELREHGLASPDVHLVMDFENRPQAGFAVAGGAHGFRNGILMPDAMAVFLSPLEPQTMLVIADALDSGGKAVAEAPRTILKVQLARLAAAGITVRIASELEFYVIRQSYAEAHAHAHAGLTPLYHRHGDNDVMVTSLAAPFIDATEYALEACGILVDQVQGEGGKGQIEINMTPDAPLTAADNCVAFKYVVKAIAHTQGLSATFLAKPFEDDAGSGGHIHISLKSSDGSNALGVPGKLTAFGEYFLAGVLAHTPELTLLHAPYANSYKRMQPGTYVPLNATWGYDNRAVMLRLIAGRDGLRFEFRLPGADANPYHAYAAIIAAGLAGVEAGCALPPEMVGSSVPESAPEIPADLTEAVARFARSALAEKAFGGEGHAHLLQHGRIELTATRKAVTNWEFARGYESA
jgi:glutamine synthetase